MCVVMPQLCAPPISGQKHVQAWATHDEPPLPSPPLPSPPLPSLQPIAIGGPHITLLLLLLLLQPPSPPLPSSLLPGWPVRVPPCSQLGPPVIGGPAGQQVGHMRGACVVHVTCVMHATCVVHVTLHQQLCSRHTGAVIPHSRSYPAIYM